MVDTLKLAHNELPAVEGLVAAAGEGVPGVITLTQPKVPEAKIRGSQKGFQWVILGLKRVSGVLKGARRGPMGPPGPPELSALSTTRLMRSAASWFCCISSTSDESSRCTGCM